MTTQRGGDEPRTPELDRERSVFLRGLQRRRLELQKAKLRERLQRDPKFAEQLVANVVLGPHLRVGPFLFRLPPLDQLGKK